MILSAPTWDAQIATGGDICSDTGLLVMDVNRHKIKWAYQALVSTVSKKGVAMRKAWSRQQGWLSINLGDLGLSQCHLKWMKGDDADPLQPPLQMWVGSIEACFSYLCCSPGRSKDTWYTEFTALSQTAWARWCSVGDMGWQQSAFSPVRSRRWPGARRPLHPRECCGPRVTNRPGDAM